MNHTLEREVLDSDNLSSLSALSLSESSSDVMKDDQGMLALGTMAIFQDGF